MLATHALFASLLLTAIPAQTKIARFESPERGLTVELKGLDGFEAQDIGADPGQLSAWWRGALEERAVDVKLWFLSREKFGLNEPEDVLDLVRDNRARSQNGFAFEDTYPLAGKFGEVPFARVGVHERREDTHVAGHVIVLGGLLAQDAYFVEIESTPALTEPLMERVLAFMKEGIEFTGEVRDRNWTEEELEARWQASAPDQVLEKDKLRSVRTEHYIVLSNLGGGQTAKKFGKKMEECHEEIREIYPFEDVEGQRLLPVFYFRTPDHYYAFCVKNLGWTEEAARRSKGVASRDFYATWHESTTDPVHIHEATHQIFGNRLRLGGGGSWFQEGVAEYMSTKKNQRKLIRKRVEKKEFTPFREFMSVPSLLMSASTTQKTGGSEAGDNYLQAACVIDFARESKWGKDRFQEFVHAVGRVPRGDLDATEKALTGVYSVGIEGFQEAFVEYWAR